MQFVWGAWRGRISRVLGTRTAAAIEVLLIVLITIGHRVYRIIPVDETLPIFVCGWFSLWLRGVGWKGVGLKRPESWWRATGIGIGTGVVLQLLSGFVTEPLIQHLTHRAQDLSEFRPLVGNLRLTLLYFALVWSWAAFGEELSYRGYVLNRAADLGGRSSVAWVSGLAFITVLFGFGHSYQGLAGMLDTGLHGLILGIVYLASGKNLWPAVIAHGVTDSIALVLVYFGQF